MNSGNLLNTLLGATSNIAVPNKNTAAKNRAETGAKFRDALEQTRPDVAAPKIRKPETNSVQADAGRAREDRVPVAKEPAERVKPASRQADKPASKTASAEKVETRKDAHQDAKIGSDYKSAKTTNETTSSEAGENTESPILEDGSTSEEIADVTGNPDLVNQLLQQAPVSNDGNKLPLGSVKGDVDTEIGAIANPEAALLNPALAAAEPNSTAVISPAQLDDEIDLALVDTETSSGTDTVLIPIQLANVNQTGQRTSVLQADGVSSSGQLNTAVEQLVVDPAIIDEPSAVAVDGSSEIDAGENPDFFTLLNAKTGISKLAESPVVTDKVIQVDVTKPPLTSSPLVEPLARLTEAQSPAARSFIAQTGVPVPVGQPQWSQAVGEKVLWLAAQNVTAAEIRLDPPDMGQLHVKVSVNQDQASVTFISPHPVVREALDQQLNRLREMFSDQGLNLVNVDVSDRSGAQQQQDQERNGHAGSSTNTEEEELVPVGATAITNLRLVDHYA